MLFTQAMVELERERKYDHGKAGVGEILPAEK